MGIAWETCRENDLQTPMAKHYGYVEIYNKKYIFDCCPYPWYIALKTLCDERDEIIFLITLSLLSSIPKIVPE